MRTVLRARLSRFLTPVIVAGLVGVGGLLATVPASGDERDDAVADQQEAEQKIDELQGEIEGLDADLANLFTELEQVTGQLTAAQDDLAVAEEALSAAQLEYEAVTEQLAAAQATVERLAAELDSSAAEEEQLSAAVGTMARDLYRGRQSSPLSLVMSAEGTGDIAQRASSAVTMSRAQTRALEQVRSSMAVVRNQAEKQEATTKRVEELQAEAIQKQQEAEAAQAEVATRVENLATAQSDLKAKQQQWDARKAEAKKQLEQWEKSRQDAADRVAKIDEENRKKALEFAEAPGPSSGNSMFGFPLPAGSAVVTSTYGWRIHPIFGTSKLHDGVDFGAACGSPQYAIRAGVVVASYFDSGGGNLVTINHGMIDGSSWVSEHLHLQSSNVSVGQQVNRGDVIGWTGSTGNSTGCHLHLTLYRDGSTVDPLDYIG